jgi:hypothetical protein
VEFAQQVLEKESKKEDKIIILDFMLDVIREDLKTDLLTTIFYNKENFGKEIKIPFPLYYYDKFGNKFHLFQEKKKIVTVNLAEDCVLILPWHRVRMRDSIKNIIKNGFTFDESNHRAYYFSYVDICYAYNGNHSIASGLGYKKGYIKAREYDVSRLFDHIYTDGLYWYNSHNNNKLCDLFDFRIGIIYEISKLKYKIESK